MTNHKLYRFIFPRERLNAQVLKGDFESDDWRGELEENAIFNAVLGLKTGAIGMGVMVSSVLVPLEHTLLFEGLFQAIFFSGLFFVGCGFGQMVASVALSLVHWPQLFPKVLTRNKWLSVYTFLNAHPWIPRILGAVFWWGVGLNQYLLSH